MTNRLAQLETNRLAVLEKPQNRLAVLDELSVEPSEEDIEKYQRMGVKEYRSPSGKLYDLTKPVAAPQGMTEQGNIDLNNQFVRRNEDGSVSTLRSMSFELDGVEILLDMVDQTGKLLTVKEAKDQYIKTGKHLGKFSSIEAANKYAQELHKSQEKLYDLTEGTATAPDLPPDGMTIQAAPEPTKWQKFKRFFAGDRPPLSPKADRMEYVDRAFDIAIGSPLRVFLKYAKGKTLNVPDLMWAGIKRVTPDSMWDENVKNMSLDEAMDWAVGYDPSGFEKTVGEVSEFIGRLQTAGQIGTSIGLLGKAPKDISVLIKAGETAKHFGLAAGFEQIAKNLAERVEPTEAEYGAEGKEAILRDMAIGAILSVAHSGLKGIWTKLKPTEQARALKLLGLKKGATEDKIIQATRQMALKTHPDKVKGLEEQFKKVMEARELLIKGPKKDIVYAKAKPAPPKLLTGERPSAADIRQAAEVAEMDAELARVQREAMAEAKKPPVEKAPIAPTEIRPIKTAEEIEKPTKPIVFKGVTETPPIVEEKGLEIKPLVKVARKFDTAEKFADKAITTDPILSKDFPINKINLSEPAKKELAKAKKEIAEGTYGRISGEPIRLFYDAGKGTYSMVDGFHRLARAQDKGSSVIDANLEITGDKQQLTDFYNQVVAKPPAAPEAKPAVEEPRQKDLIGRPVLEGGAVGRQAEFLEKEKYRLPEPDIEGQQKMRPGFIDVTPVIKAHKTFMKILEPSKAVERKLGKEPYAAVEKGIHQTDVGRLEFNQADLFKDDKTIQEFGEWLDKFPDEDLRNVMLSRGKPMSVEADLIQRDAIRKLPKELRSPRILNLIQRIADYNYKYLQSVVGDDINRVSDYFYGIYKDSKKVDKFLDYWRTTKRFTKEKKLPTVADAVNYGLELRDNNPVNNLRAEYVAIAHLEGMNWLKDELMRTGKGKFIDEFLDAPVEWNKVNDPVFSGLTLQPDLAKLINNLIATNKITKVPILDTLRQTNNFLRTVKFIGSAFHLLSVAKQSVADSGYLGFYKIAKFYERPGKVIPFGVRKGTAIQGITSGFRKNDPVFRTPAYKDYIRHGGGHHYAVESEARRVFVKTISKLNKEFGKAVKVGALPLRLPVTFVNWMFNSYIPKVKYAKYLDVVAAKEKKSGKSLTSPEKIDIIKEQQNFYGMMNERLFGRSGTVTTGLRFYFLAPGYAEGNYRTMIKAATQWGGKEGYRASRSRSNIVNSLILTGTLATVGTMIMTSKLPKKPETIEDIRDLFKIDTGKTDDKGRRIMIDLMTYDKDYWQFGFNVLKGRPDVAVKNAVKRIGGMKAPTADMIIDLALVSMGRAIYDWKGDRVTEITDPFLRRVMKLAVYEVKKLEPIPVSVFKQAKRKEIDTTIAAMEMVLGYRPTMSEKDKREQAITSRIYSLKGQQEELYQYLGTLKEPRRVIERYNKTVNQILDSKMVPPKMREEWKPKLLVDVERLLANKVYYLTSPTRTDEEVERAKEYLQNFGITLEQAQEYLNKYWARERKKTPVSPLERDRVIGRSRKRKRLRERMSE